MSLTGAEVLMVVAFVGILAVGALLSTAAAITVHARVRERWPGLEDLAGGLTRALALTVTITAAIVIAVAIAESQGVSLR